MVEAYRHDRIDFVEKSLTGLWSARAHRRIWVVTRATIGGHLTTSLQDYGVLVTDNEVVWFFDDKEFFRHPLYRANDPMLGQSYMLLDLAISKDWPVKIPASGYIDLFIDSVRLYSSD
ncbi:MAG TPA: hypothetical protein VGU45_17770 [Microvirga sp.]|nr:hypothetical protein [Microvirga sp.]